MISFLKTKNKAIYTGILSILTVCFLAGYVPGMSAFSSWLTPPLALFLGLAFALLCGQAYPKFNKKVSKKLLQYSVVGLGFGMNLQASLASGKEGMLFTIVSVVGTMLVHQGLDGIARYYNYKIGEDRFNFENESFQQSETLVSNDYSVNIPMIYYWKKKMHRGWINIINPFRGRRRTNRAISVKLIYWLKLNVNNLKSAIWVKQRKITENIRKGMTSGWLGTSVGNYRFCFPEFPTNLRTPNGLNSIILSLFGMCK